MEIEYRKGDLLKQTDISVICHQSNCLNSMGKGLALSIKKQFPEAYQVDQQTVKGDRSKLGTFTITTNTSPIIANLYGQYDYYPRNQVHTDYKAIKKALNGLGTYMTLRNLKSLGLPKFMGAGLGGGNWDTILKIIKDFADQYPNIQVVLVEL